MFAIYVHAGVGVSLVGLYGLWGWGWVTHFSRPGVLKEVVQWGQMFRWDREDVRRVRRVWWVCVGVLGIVDGGGGGGDTRHRFAIWRDVSSFKEIRLSVLGDAWEAKTWGLWHSVDSKELSACIYSVCTCHGATVLAVESGVAFNDVVTRLSIPCTSLNTTWR